MLVLKFISRRFLKVCFSSLFFLHLFFFAPLFLLLLCTFLSVCISLCVRRCLERSFLSNPRRIHSEKEDEEKEKQGSPRALTCCSPASPPLSPLPPPHRAPTALPGAALSGHTPPPSHSTPP
jgi:hypothetical protein